MDRVSSVDQRFDSIPMQLNLSLTIGVVLLGAFVGALLVLLYYAGIRQRIREEFAKELRCALYPKYRQGRRAVKWVMQPCDEDSPPRISIK